MAEIIARFADGRLLVQEERVMGQEIASGGVPIRIGLVKTVTKVLSLDAYLSGSPCERIATPLNEVKTSGDTIIPILRRADLWGLTSGYDAASGYASQGVLSGLVCSGLAYWEQLTSGATSGVVYIKANVIGY